jgi:hypothetical protein
MGLLVTTAKSPEVESLKKFAELRALKGQDQQNLMICRVTRRGAHTYINFTSNCC